MDEKCGALAWRISMNHSFRLHSSPRTLADWRWGIALLLSLGAIAHAAKTFQALPAATHPLEGWPIARNQRSHPPALPPQSQTLQLYWLNATGHQIVLRSAPLSLPLSHQPTQRLTQALTLLLAGAPPQGLMTTIPAHTQLLGLTISGNQIRINLSAEFLSQRTPLTLATRIAQVVYTVTEVVPEAQVTLLIAGHPITELGGEMSLHQSFTRRQWQQHVSW